MIELHFNTFHFRSRLQKLPDKGLKIQQLYDRAVEALELKNQIDSAAKLLSSLSLGTNDMNNFEWKDSSKAKNKVLDSDDDEDPVAILATSNSVNQNKRIVKKLQEDETEISLITDEDVKEAQEVANSTLHIDPVLEIVFKNENMDPPNRFLPYKSTENSHMGKIATGAVRKLRDNTAASPPVHEQGVKLLSLRDSIQTEYVNRQNMLKVLENQAAERLARRTAEHGPIGAVGASTAETKKSDSSLMSKYRLVSSILDEDDVEEDELSDDADDES